MKKVIIIIMLIAVSCFAQDKFDVSSLYKSKSTNTKQIKGWKSVKFYKQGTGYIFTVELVLNKPMHIWDARDLINKKLGINVTYSKVKKSLLGYFYGSLFAHKSNIITRKIKCVNFLNDRNKDQKIRYILIGFNIDYEEK